VGDQKTNTFFGDVLRVVALAKRTGFCGSQSANRPLDDLVDSSVIDVMYEYSAGEREFGGQVLDHGLSHGTEPDEADRPICKRELTPAIAGHVEFDV